MKLKQIAIALALTAGLAGSAHATSGGFAASSADFAFWDTFTGTSYTTVDTITGAFTADLTVSSGFVTGGGDRLYDFGAASSFTIAGTAHAEVDTLVFQIKYSAPASGSVNNFFTITTDLGLFTQDLAGTSALVTSQGSTTYYVYAWTFTGLDLSTNDTFTFTAANTTPNLHVSVDGFRVDAGAIPEPSTFAALAGVGVLALAAFRRRRIV